FQIEGARQNHGTIERHDEARIGGKTRQRTSYRAVGSEIAPAPYFEARDHREVFVSRCLCRHALPLNAYRNAGQPLWSQRDKAQGAVNFHPPRLYNIAAVVSTNNVARAEAYRRVRPE